MHMAIAVDAAQRYRRHARQGGVQIFRVPMQHSGISRELEQTLLEP